MDDVGYGALATALVLVGGLYTWTTYRKNGLAAGMRGASFTLFVVAAYLTKTLQMFGRIADAIGDWATRLVFSPVVWVGIVVAGIAAVLFGASRVLEARNPQPTKAPRTPRTQKTSDPARQLPASPQAPARSPAPIDDEMADIEAMLRNRGIT